MHRLLFILTGILLLVFRDSIMHLFTGDETVIAYGKICMLYFCPFYWMLGILQACRYGARHRQERAAHGDCC